MAERRPPGTDVTAPVRFERKDAAYALVLCVLAFALRAVVVQAFGVPPTWDGQFYHRGAVSIAEGHGYSEPAIIAGEPGRAPWSHYPVGYSAFIGAAYALFGSNASVAPLANAAVGAATAVLVFAFALDAIGRRRARIAGALAALHPGLVLYCALVMTEPLAGFLVLLTAYLARRLGHRWLGVGATAVAFALSAFVRPQSLITLPLLLLVFRGPLLERIKRTLAAGALGLALIAPWSVRNCLVLDGCALISTNGGWNLAIGALSETGRFRALTPEDGCVGVDGPVAQDRCWAKRGAEAIRADAWTWLSRIPDKLRHTYNHESFAVAYLAEAQPEKWEREHKWRVMNLMTLFHHALSLVAAFGAISRLPFRRLRDFRELRAPGFRDRWAQLLLFSALIGFGLYALTLPERPLFWISVTIPLIGVLPLPGAPPSRAALSYLYALLAVTSLTHMLFFGDDRYHLAISPALCILAAAAFRRPARSEAASPEIVQPTLSASIAAQ
jgi:4-amino-4-deoxy-L-arabinose transferase-like glycosyltransferase